MVNILQNTQIKKGTFYIVRIAVFAALLTVCKFAISFIPNVEVVTLIIMAIGASFGLIYALPSTLVFCAMEVALYGVSSWVILYFVYWPLLAIVSSVFLRNKNIVFAFIISVIGSILFGVLSACADTILCVSNLTNDQLALYWIAYYLRGLYFDLIHTISNAIIILVLFKPLVEVCKKLLPTEFIYSSFKIKKILTYDGEYFREV